VPSPEASEGQVSRKRVRITPEWRDALVSGLMQGGSVCQRVAGFIVERDVRIDFAKQRTGARWTWRGHVEVSLKSIALQKTPTSPLLLGQVVHEVTHLEQGLPLALSVLGEVGGWRAEFRARAELGAPMDNPHWKAVAATPERPGDDELRRARDEMLAYAGRGYLIWLLPLRPSPLLRAVAWVRRKALRR
jgi:hypothetical protein